MRFQGVLILREAYLLILNCFYIKVKRLKASEESLMMKLEFFLTIFHRLYA